MATTLTLRRYAGTPGNPQHSPANLISPGLDGLLIENDEVIEITAFGKTVTLHRGGCQIADISANPHPELSLAWQQFAAAKVALSAMGDTLSKITRKESQ